VISHRLQAVHVRGELGRDGEDPRIRVLVVDDEDSVRAALVTLLELHGAFRVVAEATDGAFAPELVEKLEPDLVLIDLRMPIVGGIDAMQLIREVDADVPMVVLSAYSDRALVRDALAAGAFEYLIKGCPAEELFETLERARRSDPSPGEDSDA
jgi:two-component system, NarL family, response regulator YdfI